MKTGDTAQLAAVRALTNSGVARSIRLAARLSLSEVADEVGASTSAVHRWERGQRNPRGEAALRYGALLTELMGRS